MIGACVKLAERIELRSVAPLEQETPLRTVCNVIAPTSSSLAFFFLLSLLQSLAMRSLLDRVLLAFDEG